MFISTTLEARWRFNYKKVLSLTEKKCFTLAENKV
jgi:hypothetical protein